MDSEQQSSSLFSLSVDAQTSYTLRSMASWAKVLGIVGITFGVILIIYGLLIQQTTTSYGYRSSNAEAYGIVIYIITALIQIVSSIFALNAGNKISTALRANDQQSLNSGFAAARNFFAIWGILLILSVIVMFLGLMTRI